MRQIIVPKSAIDESLPLARMTENSLKGSEKLAIALQCEKERSDVY